MKVLNLSLICLLLGSLVACQPIQPPAQIDPMQAKIENAMSAAPPTIAHGATILDWPAEATGDLVMLRQGDNNWTCFTDSPGTPTNDPMCLDQQWMTWLEALMTGKEPEVTTVGIAYMLQGGSDPSNTDPFATEPALGDDWVISAPHIMVVAPGGFDPAAFTTDHLSNEPYIMFEGTPYEHLMVPVADLETDMGAAAGEEAALAQFAHPEALATTGWLADHLHDANLRIVDVRWDAQADYAVSGQSGVVTSQPPRTSLYSTISILRLSRCFPGIR